MRRDAAPDDLPAQLVDRDEERVQRVGAAAARRQYDVDPAAAARDAPQLRRDVGVRLGVDDRDDLRAERLDLRPDARLEPLARHRPDRLPDHDRDPQVQERRDADDRPAAVARQPLAGRHRRLVDDGRRDLDARDEVAGPDDRAVERGEHLERVDPVEPLQLPGPDEQHAAGLCEQVDPALVWSTDRDAVVADGRREPQRRVVLVKVARLEDEDRDPLSGDRRRIGRQRRQVGRREPPALRPALGPDPQVAREDGPGEAVGRARAGLDPLDSHPPIEEPAYRPRAASIARRV